MFRELQVKQDKLMHQIKMLQKQVNNEYTYLDSIADSVFVKIG